MLHCIFVLQPCECLEQWINFVYKLSVPGVTLHFINAMLKYKLCRFLSHRTCQWTTGLTSFHLKLMAFNNWVHNTGKGNTGISPRLIWHVTSSTVIHSLQYWSVYHSNIVCSNLHQFPRYQREGLHKRTNFKY